MSFWSSCTNREDVDTSSEISVLVNPDAKAPISEDPRDFFKYSGEGPWWVCKPTDVVQPRLAERGIGGPETAPTTLPVAAMEAAKTKANMEAQKVERPCPPLNDDGTAPEALPLKDWKTWTWSEYVAETRTMAKGYMAMGFQQFDTVNIWGFNSPEWSMSMLASTFAGGKAAGIYPTDTDDTVAYKVVHSGGVIVVCEDSKKVERLGLALKARSDVKRLKAVVAYGYTPPAGETLRLSQPIPVMGWEAFQKTGSGVSDAQLDSRVGDVDPGHCAMLVYTSGTTGEPKAAMISHDSIVFEAKSFAKECEYVGWAMDAATPERILSYLPLSHVAGLLIDVLCPLVNSSSQPGGVTIFYARPYDQKAGTMKDRLCAVHPTFFLGVPLVWEKIADKMRAIGEAKPAPVKAISSWAKSLGLQKTRNTQLGGSGEVPFMYPFVEKILLKKVAAALGLECCKFAMTGAAPIRVDTAEYWGSLGIDLMEAYGMSECTGACTVSVAAARQLGSCGSALPGVEVKAFNVDSSKMAECPRAPSLQSHEEKYQGELCYRGRNIMMGYMANPDLGQKHVQEIEKKNAETIDQDGWLHSGDKGLVTQANMVKITGRYKELIIGDGGENIAPVPIEDFVKKTCDGINEFMMVGDKRKYNVALVTLKAKGATGEVAGSDELDMGALKVNPAVTTISAAMDDPVWIDTIKKAIEAVNNNGQVCRNSAYKIQKFAILPTNFSEEAGELTPTRKLKRKAVEEKFKALIDKMYTTEGVYIHA